MTSPTELSEPELLPAATLCPNCKQPAETPGFVVCGRERMLCSDPIHAAAPPAVPRYDMGVVAHG